MVRDVAAIREEQSVHGHGQVESSQPIDAAQEPEVSRIGESLGQSGPLHDVALACVPSTANGQTAPSAVHSSRNSPEPLQIDRQGHYVGPASGASFLLRIQRRLQTQQTSRWSDSSIFTFGDLPLPEFNPSFLILPPKNEAEGLVKRYFEFAAATHRFYHQPTVETWLEELYETNGAMRQEAGGRSRTAALFMIFAQSTHYPTSSSGKQDMDSR